MSNTITLRRARPDDSRLLWEWRNGPDVRATAFSPDPIPWERHQAWFERKLSDPNVFIFVAEIGQNQPVGQIRFDINAGEAEVDVIVDRMVRSKGIGTELIRRGTEAVFEEAPVTAVIASVKSENIKSVLAFKRAGYKRVGSTDLKGVATVQLHRQRSFS